MLHSETLQPQAKGRVSVGIWQVRRKDLLAYQKIGQQLSVDVVGMLVLSDDIAPELADATLGKVKVVGVLVANPVLRATLGRRLKVVGFTSDTKEE